MPPLTGARPPLREILDPPLLMINLFQHPDLDMYATQTQVSCPCLERPLQCHQCPHQSAEDTSSA